MVIAWALESGDAVPPAWPLPGLRGWRQVGADLGERMFHSLARAAESFEVIGAVGTDHPSLGYEEVEQAFLLLEGPQDIVLGPALDGGYYLIAMNRQALDRRLFADIEWSSARVLKQTLARCRELQLRCHLLPPARDVDRAQDLQALEVSIEARELDVPKVEALLARWKMSREGSPS